MGWSRVFICVVLGFYMTACSTTQEAPPASSTQSTSQQQTIIDSSPSSPAYLEGIVAQVNGIAITNVAYQDAMTRRSAMANIADADALAMQVLTELIEQQLINQGALNLGVIITDADIDAEIAAQKEIAGGTEAWQQSLIQNNYTEEEWYAAQRDVLTTLGVRNQLIQPYLGEIEQVNARHILVRTEEEANQVLDRLANGDGFATLAAQYSLDVTTAEIGGNLGWFAHNELYYPNLETIAFNLEDNEIAGPIATSLGYHIIQTLDHDIKSIEMERLPTLSENVFNNWLDEQYRNATIEIYNQ